MNASSNAGIQINRMAGGGLSSSMKKEIKGLDGDFTVNTFSVIAILDYRPEQLLFRDCRGQRASIELSLKAAGRPVQ